MRPIFQHNYQEANNRILEFTEDQGTVQYIFRRRYLSEDVEQLFLYVTEALFRAKRPIIFYQNFTLVNIYAPTYHFSHGYCPPPPQEVIFPASSLILTFAMTRRYYDESIANWNPENKMRYPRWSYMWGESLQTRYDFFTISIPITKVRQFKLRAIMSENLHYLYNVMSSLTKNWITHIYYFPYLDNMFRNHSKFYNMKFPDLMRRYSYKQLPYLKWTWIKATNLITIDYNSALYYFLYIHGTIPVQDRTEGDMLSRKLFGDNSILTLLKISIDRYNNQREALDLLLVASLYGKNHVGQDYFAELKEIHQNSNLIISGNDAEDIIRGNLTADQIDDGVTTI